jgi:CDP-6-deoxy-D-xylo-4-hexulose-3-dehydrase
MLINIAAEECFEFMLRGRWKEWKPGDPVLINRIVWGQPEIDKIQEVLDNDWFGPNQKVTEFTKSISDYTDIPHIQPVNSGSTALTLAVEAMVELKLWQPGDLILHPLLTFPTSIVPAAKAGLKVVFVDVDPNTYQIDLELMKAAINIYGDHIKGAIIPHLLGNISDMALLMDILDGRPFIEDCCDTMGGYYDGLHVGNFGHIAAFSFYGSHHVTTAGVGGALATHSEEIYNYAKSATHWGRNDYALLGDQYEKFSRRYWYETLGSDYQMTEIQAAFGIIQMARLDRANEKRSLRFWELALYFSQFDDYFHLPYAAESGDAMPSWFCYPLTIKPEAPFDRREFATYLIENKIEIRPIFTGNILEHPAFSRLPPHRKMLFNDQSRNADLIGTNGLFLPAWGMSDGEMAYMMEVLSAFFRLYKRGV